MISILKCGSRILKDSKGGYYGVADNSIPDVTCLGKIGDTEKYRKN